MEGLHPLKENLEQGDYLCKLDIKDPYFCVPQNKYSKKYVRLKWEGSLYFCLCFGLGTTPRLFTKLIKVLISILRKFTQE